MLTIDEMRIDSIDNMLNNASVWRILNYIASLILLYASGD